MYGGRRCGIARVPVQLTSPPPAPPPASQVLSPGLIGGLVLPVMGAIPDGAMVLFSGLGAHAQTQLKVGVGTLAVRWLTPWGPPVPRGGHTPSVPP